MVKGWERKYCPLEHGYWSISIDDCECEDRGVFQIGSTRHEWFFSSLDNSFPFPVRRDSSQTSRRQTWHLNPWKSCIIRVENAQWHKIRIWSSSSLPGFIFDKKSFLMFRIYCPSFLFPFLSLCHYEHFNFYHERAILFCFSVIGLRSASLWLLLLSAIFYEFLAAVGFPILPRNCLAANELQHKSPCRKYTKLRAQ